MGGGEEEEEEGVRGRGQGGGEEGRQSRGGGGTEGRRNGERLKKEERAVRGQKSSVLGQEVRGCPLLLLLHQTAQAGSPGGGLFCEGGRKMNVLPVSHFPLEVWKPVP